MVIKMFNYSTVADTFVNKYASELSINLIGVFYL
jgi:hypothetical protein